MTKPSIVLLRYDLRLGDQPALAAAARGPVLPLFLLDEASPGLRPLGAASRWWLHHSLASLASDLAALGAPLAFAVGRGDEVVPAVARAVGAGAVHHGRRYQRAEMDADEAMAAALARDGVATRSHNTFLLREPGDVVGASGGPVHVFTPYWKRHRALPAPDAALPAPARLDGVAPPPGPSLDDLGFLPRFDWAAGFRERWRPGEGPARERLDLFVRGAAARYGAERDRIDSATTSALSPSLRFGEVSARQVWHAARAAHDAGTIDAAHHDKFASELAWRDYGYHLLAAYPDLPTRPHQARFADFPWREDPVALGAWRRGRTGYPVVDASMRELRVTGWMPNRARMITGSFLCKHLLIDWRRGEEFFWDSLVDADPASNAFNWQWIGGSGIDAAPFFRVFHPVTQAEKFDPEGAYVRRWLPALARLPNRLIQRPWEARPVELSAAGVRLGRDHPAPIVDHAAARERALEAFRSTAAHRREAAA